MLRSMPITAVVLICLIAPLSAQEKAEVVTFKTRSPAVGEFQSAMIKSSNETSVSMMRDGEEALGREVSMSSTTARDATILEVKDGKITKVKFHWRKIVRENSLGDMATSGRRGRRGQEADAEPTPDVSELSGKTLILDLSGATPAVTDEEGKDAGEGLTRLVSRMESNEGVFTGWSPEFLELLGKKEFTVGESIPLKREIGRKILGSTAGARARGGRRGGRGGRGGEEAGATEDSEAGYTANLVFKGKRVVLGNDCGLFEVSATDSMDRSDERMKSNSKTTLSGEILIGVDNGWVYGIEIKGKSNSATSISMEERSMESSSNGTMEMHRQVIYALPKAAPAN